MACAAVLVAAFLALTSVAPEYMLPDLDSTSALRLKPDYQGIRLVVDNWDRDEHLRRGEWIRTSHAPYRGAPSEYPQVATYVFGILHLCGTSRQAARFAYSATMLASLLALLAATNVLLTMLGKPRAWLLLLCLPSALYFGASRYDALVAALVAASLLLLLNERGCGAMIFLALAVLTKWYPAVLAPLYLKYLHSRRGRLPWLEGAAGLVVIAMFMVQTLLWAGWEGLLAPYQRQSEISGNAESLCGLLQTFGLESLAWQTGFAVLQLSSLLLAAVVHVRTREHLLAAAAFAVMAFICCGIRHSPQWVLWVSPLLVLTARSRRDLVLIATYDLLTYLYFPLGYDLYEGTWAFTAILAVHACFRTVLLVRLGMRVAWSGPRLAVA